VDGFIDDLNCRHAPPTDEIRIAELADGLAAIFLPAGPKIAPREADEHGSSADIHTLALLR
jgi:hypothetical protein